MRVRAAAPEVYRIGPEDILQISVWKNDAMSRTLPVRPDGKISLPLLSDVQAAGLTAIELREILTKKLAEYMPNPEVSVIVSEIRSFKVSVIGEVSRPGNSSRLSTPVTGPASRKRCAALAPANTSISSPERTQTALTR